ncbi:MAG: hypothetical protein ACLQFR_12465 [Streptosporangiaceae bacterium]
MSALRLWLARRRWPLLATAAVIAIGMIATTVGGHPGKLPWALPDDLWGTLAAARRLLHLNLAGLYTPPTRLVTLPGAAVILVPIAAIAEAAGVPLAVQSAHNPHPVSWLLAGPYEIALCGLALVAADALAERAGATQAKRALLAVAGGAALSSVAILWGHPEDAVAVGLLLYAVKALADRRTGRSGWLVGAAVAVQPLVLLALPVVLMTIELRRVPGFLARAATPSAVLLGAAAAANWSVTIHAVTSQPNWPSVDHPTPWESFAPRLSDGAVAAGPFRTIAILAACLCALAAGRRWRAAWHTAWDAQTLHQVLWWAAVALALRCVFEPVMVAYYLWPVLAVALVAAAGSWPSLIATSVAAAALTAAAQTSWHGQWAWWATMTAGLAVTLCCARVQLPAKATAPSTDLAPSVVSNQSGT